jgi:hypothetical protein
MPAEPRLGNVRVPFFQSVEWEPAPGVTKMAVLTCGRSDCAKPMAIALETAISYRGTSRPCLHCSRAGHVPGDMFMSEEEVERFKAEHGDAEALARLPLLRG